MQWKVQDMSGRCRPRRRNLKVSVTSAPTVAARSRSSPTKRVKCHACGSMCARKNPLMHPVVREGPRVPGRGPLADAHGHRGRRRQEGAWNAKIAWRQGRSRQDDFQRPARSIRLRPPGRRVYAIDADPNPRLGQALVFPRSHGQTGTDHRMKDLSRSVPELRPGESGAYFA